MKQAMIKALEVYLPERVVENIEIERQIAFEGGVEPGFLSKTLGSKSRRFAAEETQVSDLAAAAGSKLLQANPVNIDLLIFAAASSDLIEPATANIVQEKLGLRCPVLDIKNACNSFVSSVHVATAFIEAGTYQNILIVCGEKLSEVINYTPNDRQHFRRSLSGYSLGDAGAAMLISNKDGSRIAFQKFMSWGEHWRICTVEGGGSLAYWNADKYFFQCESAQLQQVFLSNGVAFIEQCLQEAGWSKDELDLVVSHQVAASTANLIAESLGIPPSKFIRTFSKYGNTAAATIPIALHEALESNQLVKGDKVMLLGLAAGVSLSVQLVIW
jgi:3-oxoacyl-[acyl-carrier-protein] synthase-3